jgi:hypothetical protein
MAEITDDFVHRDLAGKYSLGFAYYDDTDKAGSDPRTVTIDMEQFRPTNETNAQLLQKVLALQVEGRRFEKDGERWHLRR